ncbi:MAG: type II toxin-antitoxin system ParD family antitoxin [Chrysiogenetes bacterium]|nr:type II toxin-antitoxin system ParD family antitoxin [Chrysiogenetes bacterium]
MNVSLTPELEALINEKVASGRYTSASEVIREALRLMEAREERALALRSALLQGLESGEPQPFDAKKLRADIKRRAKSRSK